MGVMTDRQSVAANASIPNVMSGKSQEFITEASRVRFSVVGAAIGLFCTCLVGDEVVVEDQEVSSANRSPLVPDDLLADAGGLPGDRVVVKLRNSTGAAIVGFSRVDIEPA